MRGVTSRRNALRLFWSSLVLGLASACATSSGQRQAAVPSAAQGEVGAAAPEGLSVTVANSELVVGPNRFTVGLIEDGRALAGETPTLEFFQLSGQTGTKRGQIEAVFRTLDGVKGFYTAWMTFDVAGLWGVQASLRRGGDSLTARRTFEVLAISSAPVAGTRARPSGNPVAGEVGQLAEICSAQPPCEMHDLSIRQALGLNMPTVITFATPGFCTSQTCAPVLGEVERVRARRIGQASFVHIEIYKEPRNLVLADTVQDWGLRSEPWIFLVGRDGVVATRVESLVIADELEALLVPLL